MSNTTTTRVRDIERRFLQRNGWQAHQAYDRDDNVVWQWSHPRYKRSYDRTEAFNREMIRQSRGRR